MSWLLACDNAILDFIQQFRCSALDVFMPWYSSLGNHGRIWIFLAIAMLCFKKTRRCGAVMGLSLILCLLSGNLLLKPLVARVRPYDANGFTGLLVKPLKDFSFPSGHTFAAFAAAASTLFYFRKSGLFVTAAACLMALSRLYLYVHYPSDILGGIALGVAAAFLSHAVLEKLFRRFDDTHRLSGPPKQTN